MTNPDSIRKAAILVSLLDTASADALLEPMGDELAARVRQAVMDLDDVSAEEQEQVLAEFLGHDTEEVPSGGGVELELSDDGLESTPSSHAPPPAPSQASPSPSLSFLADVSPRILAETLVREHPQTIAVVIAHVPPEHAGQVLQRLPSSLATEALSRIAWLTTPSPDVLADLESALRRRLALYGGASSAGTVGIANLQAILASLPSPARKQLIQHLARHDENLASRLGGASAARDEPPAEHSQVVSFRYRLANSNHAAPARDCPRHAALVPLVEFEDLASLADRDLDRLAAVAQAQTLALALIEADEALAGRLLRGLSAAEAALIRQRLVQPGPLRLADIDRAQRQLADLARQLAACGQINLPRSRHFAAAA